MINFFDIEEDNIAIGFDNNIQLQELIKYLNAFDYTYGTTKDNLNEIKINYFTKDNYFLSLDRSKAHHSRNYASCGLGYKDKVYMFKDIDWSIN